jgi:sugar lactone lactonase YvrE
MKKTLFGFLILFFLCFYSAQAQIITTVAGCSSCPSLGDGGPAIDAQLFHPISIVFDDAGNYYITDRDNNRIRKVTPAGIITTIAGTGTAAFSGDNGPATAADISVPYGIAIDAAGNIYFTDGGGRIRKINTAGIITTIAGNGTGVYNGDSISATAAGINGTGGIAIDSAGNIYVPESGNQRVRKISASGIISTIAGTGAAGYNGNEIAATDAQLHNPNYVCLDKAGNVYVADRYNNQVRVIDGAGVIHAFAGDTTSGYTGDNGPATAAGLYEPLGLYIDRFQNIYIGDTYNNVVRKVNTTGIITTIAGNGTGGYSGDNGLAILAELGLPVGVTMDTVGNIYIADGGQSHIRRISSTLLVPQINASNVLHIYPNPCTDHFTVSAITSADEPVKITLGDITGHRIKELEGITNTLLVISLKDVPPGAYIVYAATAAGVQSEKIVKIK